MDGRDCYISHGKGELDGTGGTAERAWMAGWDRIRWQLACYMSSLLPGEEGRLKFVVDIDRNGARPWKGAERASEGWMPEMALGKLPQPVECAGRRGYIADTTMNLLSHFFVPTDL